MLILNSKDLVEKKTKNLKNIIKKIKKKPKMTIIQVGNILASNKYVSFKLKKAMELNIDASILKIKSDVSQKNLIKIIKNESFKTDGLIVQLPLPKHLEKQVVLNAIPINIDIDGLAAKNNRIIPATAKGVIELLKYYKIKIANKEIAVVGQSKLVGKPISDLLELEGGNVTRYDLTTGICGTEKADILVVALGKPNFIKKGNIKNGVIIIDVGVNIFSNKKIVGDVDRESIGKIPFAITPMFGGVGPMTIISLFENFIGLL